MNKHDDSDDDEKEVASTLGSVMKKIGVYLVPESGNVT